MKHSIKETQLKLPLPSTHGGRRKGAGRPKKPGARPRHEKRETVAHRTPLHLTMKLLPGILSLRSAARLKLFAHAVRGASRHGLKIQHFSLQSNHLHLIAEAKDNFTLSKGMQSLAVALARGLKKAMGKDGCEKSGQVFFGRYHLHVLRTPREVKNALIYVLSNSSKHAGLKLFLDTYSSAWHFTHWQEAFGSATAQRLKRGFEDPPPWMSRLDPFLSPAQSWLLERGWLRA